ncbi:hypothetical protein N7491_002750 [Penicillium cf. griseofulvum]|uniref:EKC/KEOPS complex subunit BUD32 n=1 Tax=Penicillium cf. griseofulvum TaxID=2972120 RepID=A0A9W9MSE9_9EURO|nr:hypothetical protein N7472_003083 [Penicillium cf. griseofulvum]KAJ5440344.1 hypothetical protein N7491_002750 [Penicillium cf. griseofulvum]
MSQSLKDPFAQQVQQLRAAYNDKRAQSNLTSSPGQRILNLDIATINGVTCYTYWYQPSGRCLRLAVIPGTLSGDILSLEQNVPLSVLNGDFEIIGDQIRPLENIPPLPEPDDDSENLSALLTSLPILDIHSDNVNPDKYFLKKSKYKSEISGLLKCQGGSCPGAPKSPHVIQLLGRSRDGRLVFEKFKPRWLLVDIYPLATYKEWIFQVISGLKCLHSCGIIHRDLRIDNLVFSTDIVPRVIICDLESRWGNRLAPEISREPVLDAGWTEMSDIYDLGGVIKGMIYGNVPITHEVKWPIPPPFDTLVEACTWESSEDCPSLDELYAMVEQIK